MVAKNPIPGDSIQTRGFSETYESNYSNIFKKSDKLVYQLLFVDGTKQIIEFDSKSQWDDYFEENHEYIEKFSKHKLLLG